MTIDEGNRAELIGLEDRYRRAIERWYPESWRREHERAMLGTLLDVAEANPRRANVHRQLRAVAVQGLAVRVALALPAEIADTTSGILTGAAAGLAVASFAVLSIPFSDQPFLGVAVPHPSLDVLAVGWLAALGLAFTRSARVTRIALVGVAVLTLLMPALRTAVLPGGYPWRLPDAATVSFLAISAGIAALGRPRRRTLVVSFLAGLVTFGGVQLLSRSSSDLLWLPIWGGPFNQDSPARGSFGFVLQRLDGGTLIPVEIHGATAMVLLEIVRIAILPLAALAVGAVIPIVGSARHDRRAVQTACLCVIPWIGALTAFMTVPPTATYLF